MPARETVMAALYGLISGSTVFETTTRRWQNFQNDPNARLPDLPMVVQFEGDELTEYRGERGLPSIRSWDVHMLVYGKIPDGQTPGTPDSSTPGASVVNPLIDEIESLLAPDPLSEGVQTLGGLVVDCRIEGPITKALGDQDPSGLCGAVIPVKIIVP